MDSSNDLPRKERAMADMTRFLEDAGIDFDVLEHPHTERAADEAATLGIGGKKVQLASEDNLARDYPDFELGAVPPFGGPEDHVLVDEGLVGRDSVVVEAGSHN